MLLVIICAFINLGLLLGLFGGLVAGIAGARGAIVTALVHDPLAPVPARLRAAPA